MWVRTTTLALGVAGFGLCAPALAQRSLFDQPTAPAPAAPAVPAPAAPSASQGQSAEAAQAKPRPRKPRGPTPARALTINNASSNVLASLTVSGENKTAKLSKPVKAKGRATLKLPAFKTCTVTVAATFEGNSQTDSSELDICKDKSLRLTD